MVNSKRHIMNKIKFISLAAAVAAMAFTFSCSSDDGDDSISSSSGGGSSSSSSSDAEQSSSSSSVVPNNSSCANFVEGTRRQHHGIMKEQFCDERDGQKYVYVMIGTQTWMAENLNYDIPNVTTDVCYDNSPDNCTEYGRQYDWLTAMAISQSGTYTGIGPNHRGICPAGWHIPSADEWDALVDNIGGSSTAGTKLKAESGWNDSYNGSNGNGTDDYGFSALPSGIGNGGPNHEPFFIGDVSYWWLAGERSEYEGHSLNIYNTRAYTNRGTFSKDALFNVRCVKNL